MNRRLTLQRCVLITASLLGLALPAMAQNVLRLSTTTSTENSGLLKFLLPAFEAQFGLKVEVISVGTGKALELAKNGDVDVTLVHARAAEDKFVAEGHGVNRRCARSSPAVRGLCRAATIPAPTRWSRAGGRNWASVRRASNMSPPAWAWAKYSAWPAKCRPTH
jgi:hypothetical protein